jgi:hypothetical protein
VHFLQVSATKENHQRCIYFKALLGLRPAMWQTSREGNIPAARQGTASQKNGWEIFHQPLYNPDLVLSEQKYTAIPLQAWTGS